MVAIVRRRVRAEADGVITVKCPEVRKGDEVEVIVKAAPPVDDLPSFERYFGICRGLFGSDDEIVEFIRQERQSWER